MALHLLDHSIDGVPPIITFIMTAIKKTTKSTKSPAPATKSGKASNKKAAAAAPAPAPAPVAAPVDTVTAEVVTKLVAGVAGVPKAVSAKPVTTTIIAVLDVGFGNTLFLRGQGPGLSWDQGIPMTCVAPNEWQIALPESARGYTFKVLINDFTWSQGSDFFVESGGTITITPEF